MIINHPLLGPRDSEEFVYLGSTKLMDRPTNWEEDASSEDFYQYQYIRENIAGDHQELWYHEQGDQSWLVVTRNTITHEITTMLPGDSTERCGSVSSLRDTLPSSWLVENGTLHKTRKKQHTIYSIIYTSRNVTCKCIT